MGSDAVFQKNLSTLRKRSSQLGAALEAASCEDVEEVVGPRGAEVLRQRGILLGSAYDPQREAKSMAAAMAARPADIMIAIGFGLGEQFADYCELNPCTVIVYEPSLPRLRAALHRVSLSKLYASRRDFYITTDLDQFSRVFDARYCPGLRIRVFTHPAVLRLDPEAVNCVVERTRRVKEAADTSTVTSIDQMIPWAQIVAGNGRRIATRPSLGALENSFAGKPAVVVAAGPSLDKQLSLLREFQDRILIISIGQTVKTLVAAGIQPHLVHILESQDVSHQLTIAGNASELNVILAPDCHPDIFDVSTRSCFVATTSLSPMGQWIESNREDACFTIGGGTVALGAVGIAQKLGVSTVMLIGQDLAFTDGRAYAKNSAYDFVGVEVSEEGTFEFTNGKRKLQLFGEENPKAAWDRLPGDVIYVDGWNEGERVATWRAYATFLEQYRDMGRYLEDQGIQLVNCTEGGARIPGVKHARFADVLAEQCEKPINAMERIQEIYESAPTYELAYFKESIVRARRSLDRIERDAEKALRFAEKKGPNSTIRPKSDQQMLEVLRGLARHEKKVRTGLTRIPWLDALVQPEIYSAMAAARRTERLDPSVEELFEESRFLLEAAVRGVRRARQWFDDFEASFRVGDGAPATEKPPAWLRGLGRSDLLGGSP